MGLFDGLSNIISGGANALTGGSTGKLGDWISANPEMFAMGADAIGKNLAPNNAFQGIGTAWGQSSLANKARAEEVKEQQEWKSLFSKILTGEVKTTPAGTPGVTGFSTKPGKDGGLNEITLKVDEPTSALAEKPANQNVNMSELMSLSPF